MISKSKKIISIMLIFVLLLIAAALFFYFTLPEVRVVKVQKGSINETAEETGYVRAKEFYDVQAPTAGQVIKLVAANGQQVKKGQPIIILQNLPVETQLATLNRNILAAVADRDNSKAIINIAKTDLEEAKKDIARKSSLYKSGVISQVEYEMVENNMRKAKDTIASLDASLEGAEQRLAAMLSQKKGLTAQLGQLVINSPIDGRVLSLPVKVGQVVPSGATLATVGSQAAFEVYAEILSDEIVRVKPGQIADVFFGARNGNSVTGKVKEIFPQALEKLSPLGVHQRRVPVVVTLDDNGPLKPGYEVKLSIRTDTRQNALLIPRESVSVEKDGSETVRIIKSGRVVVSKITTGLKNQFNVELLKGPAVGELLLRDGSFLYRDGAWVRVTAE